MIIIDPSRSYFRVFFIDLLPSCMFSTATQFLLPRRTPLQMLREKS
jgi:hypothetical protein